MNPQVKSAWVHALRSGVYEQIRGYLRTSKGFCPLGVLADISGLNEWQPTQIRPELFFYDGSLGTLSQRILDWAGLSERNQSRILMLGDDENYDFDAIADRIEDDL